ncbi:MAG: hypothetical protein DRI94_06695 [Bacteroidetes bacterium]|nr:MAG: hypothetical protein DRI94_06695 [Bacteroidota bacterium]
MLQTVLDFSIFEDFVNLQPKQIPLGSEEENYYWLSFWNYLKNGTDLSIINFKETQNIFLTSLTTGRKGTKIKLSENFKKPYKNILPRETNIQSVFFIDEEDENEQQKYRNKNSLFFAFKNDYKIKWKELSLFKKSKILSVEKAEKLQFHSWSVLNEYLLPFSDLIIFDNFIFSGNKKKLQANLFKIIKEFSKVASVKFNLLIVSYIGYDFILNVEKIYDTLKEFLREEKIECNPGIVLTTNAIKRHDRAIYSNYLRINSGDSFNYFKSDGTFATKGTEITFFPLCENEKYITTENSLKKISEIIDNLAKREDADKYLIGNIKNKLLKFNT